LVYNLRGFVTFDLDNIFQALSVECLDVVSGMQVRLKNTFEFQCNEVEVKVAPAKGGRDGLSYFDNFANCVRFAVIKVVSSAV